MDASIWPALCMVLSQDAPILNSIDNFTTLTGNRVMPAM